MAQEKDAKELMRQSQLKKRAAEVQEQIGKAQIKNNVKSGSMGTDYQYGGKGTPIPIGKERIDIANNLRKEATEDSIKATKMK